MKRLVNRIKAYVMDRKIERKEAALAAKRQAMKEACAYAAPVATVATLTATALAGSFSFM